jgi:hypothetical protein
MVSLDIIRGLAALSACIYPNTNSQLITYETPIPGPCRTIHTKRYALTNTNS